ncbi:MAG: hypothetical protein IPK24_22740 [Kineosporiaceae bacterium]|nr:hypothetical protein [Kineosporiaceae bacterium]
MRSLRSCVGGDGRLASRSAMAAGQAVSPAASAPFVGIGILSRPARRASGEALQQVRGAAASSRASAGARAAW